MIRDVLETLPGNQKNQKNRSDSENNVEVNDLSARKRRRTVLFLNVIQHSLVKALLLLTTSTEKEIYNHV